MTVGLTLASGCGHRVAGRAPASPGSTAADVQTVGWMVGHWQRPEGIEHWTAAGGVLWGVGFSTREGQTALFEVLLVEAADGGLRYVAMPNGRPEVAFAAASGRRRSGVRQSGARLPQGYPLPPRRGHALRPGGGRRWRGEDYRWQAAAPARGRAAGERRPRLCRRHRPPRGRGLGGGVRPGRRHVGPRPQGQPVGARPSARRWPRCSRAGCTSPGTPWPPGCRPPGTWATPSAPRASPLPMPGHPGRDPPRIVRHNLAPPARRQLEGPVRHRQLTARSAPGELAGDGLLPVAAVEGRQGQAGHVDAVQAAHVHVHLVGVRAGNVKRV